MIYNRDESEVQVLGEIQKYKVSIDERNINHIVTILSSNLYSFPMASFLRETVSNAVDSHIEAGSKEPIILYRTAHDISIRDYGTGISPERFKEIYLNIGSSTKRQSNDYIGSFGIGRFSCLSVSDLANITSFYNGKAYYYVMNKDIDQLHIDCIMEQDTTEPNGVEVKVPVSKWDASTLRGLSFIENLFVKSEIQEDNYIVSSFNGRKVLSYQNFKVLILSPSSIGNKTEILLGKIPYQVDYMSLWDYSDSWHKAWHETFAYVYPHINIGEVDITPNRENLLYSERTKQKLREVYDACIEEITQMWNAQCNREYQDIRVFMNEISDYRSNYLKIDGFDIPLTQKLPYNAKFKGHSDWDGLDPQRKKEIIKYFLHAEIETLGEMENETLRRGKRSSTMTIKHLLANCSCSRTILALPTKAGFSSRHFRDFVNENYDDNYKLFLRQIHIDGYHIKSFIRRIFGITMLADSTYRHFLFQLIREVLHYIKDKIIVTDIIGSAAYAQYKKDHAVHKQYNTSSYLRERMQFAVYCTDSGNIQKTISTPEKIIPFVKDGYGRKRRIVYAEFDSPFIPALMNMNYPRLAIIGVAKGRVKMLKQSLPDWIRPVEELYSPDNRTLQKYAAIKYIFSHEGGNINKHCDTLSCFPAPINKMIEELKEYQKKFYYEKKPYSDADASHLIDQVPPEKYDPLIMALFRQVKPFLKACSKLQSHAVGSHMEYYFLMKAKKLRLDYDYYKDVRRRINCIINIL